MSRRYQVYDVFTEAALTGNPLAIVLDGAGLDDAQMQAIAGEFNLSETVFVLPPDNPAHSARVRIFTPRTELNFAGHPTVGTAICLARQRFGETSLNDGGEQDVLIVLEENVGPVRCGVRLTASGGFAEFDGPSLPEIVGKAGSRHEIAAACGLDSTQIGFENHAPSVWSAGVTFTTVPVKDRAVLAEAQAVQPLWQDVFGEHGVYFYCRDPEGHDHHFRARMLDPVAGIPEDPATGSAVAALSGAIQQFDDLPDGENLYIVEQGFEMGRPSLIRLEIVTSDSSVKAYRIGGSAAAVANGELDL